MPKDLEKKIFEQANSFNTILLMGSEIWYDSIDKARKKIIKKLKTDNERYLYDVQRFIIEFDGKKLGRQGLETVDESELSLEGRIAVLTHKELIDIKDELIKGLKKDYVFIPQEGKISKNIIKGKEYLENEAKGRERFTAVLGMDLPLLRASDLNRAILQYGYPKILNIAFGNKQTIHPYPRQYSVFFVSDYPKEELCFDEAGNALLKEDQFYIGHSSKIYLDKIIRALELRKLRNPLNIIKLVGRIYSATRGTEINIRYLFQKYKQFQNAKKNHDIKSVSFNELKYTMSQIFRVPADQINFTINSNVPQLNYDIDSITDVYIVAALLHYRKTGTIPTVEDITPMIKYKGKPLIEHLNKLHEGHLRMKITEEDIGKKINPVLDDYRKLADQGKLRK